MDRARKQVIGKYKNPEDVKATLQRLGRDGYAREDVTLYTNNTNVRDFQNDYDIDMLADETRVVDKTEDNRSFWDEIKDMVSYDTSDEGKMRDDENELIAPYREDIDNGYTVIAVREGITNLSGTSATAKNERTESRDEPIPEAGAKYNPNEEPLADAPGDYQETDMPERANDKETHDKHIEHEHVEGTEQGSVERFYTVDGQLVSESDTDQNAHSNLDVMADEERLSDTEAISREPKAEINLEDNLDRQSNNRDISSTDSELDSVLDRDLTNKDDTLFDDPVDSSASDEMKKREEDYNRLDPDNDIRYDPKHRDMDL